MLADPFSYQVFVMPSAKGFVSEDHSQITGTYWGDISTAFCAEIVESADAYLFDGPIFNLDTLFFSRKRKPLLYNLVVWLLQMDLFFYLFYSERIRFDKTIVEICQRIYVPEGLPFKSKPKSP